MEEEILEKDYKGQRQRYKVAGKGDYEFNVEDSCAILNIPPKELAPSGGDYVRRLIVFSTAEPLDNSYYHWLLREFPFTDGRVVDVSGLRFE